MFSLLLKHINSFRRKFFYLTKEVAQIKESALIDAQGDLEKDYEELEDAWDELDNREKLFEREKSSVSAQMADKLTRLTIYMGSPDRVTKVIELQYAEHWDSYVERKDIYKHIVNQLVKKMEDTCPF